MINKIINLWKTLRKKRIDKGGFYKKIIFMGFLKGNEKIATEGIYRLGKRIPKAITEIKPFFAEPRRLACLLHHGISVIVYL